MWNWLFPPRCPIGTEEKVWVESRMTWLAQQFGVERMLKAQVIEPTDEYFPEAYHGTEEDAQRMFRKLLGFLNIDPSGVEFEVRHDWNHNSPLGTYQQGMPARICLHPAQLEDPESLIGTLAHELAHHLLLGGGLLQDNNEDLERLTDLLPIYFGLGIFGANSVVREKTIREGRYSEWSIRKQGYLPMRMHAYGLAVFAYAREEWRPRWARHLRPDIAHPLAEALRFLRSTSDCTFRAKPPLVDKPQPSVEDCVALLRVNSPTQRYLALCDLHECGSAAAPAVQSLCELLHDADSDVALMAARVLENIGPDAATSTAALREMLTHRNANYRTQAGHSLAAVGEKSTETVKSLLRALEDDNPQVAAAAALALGVCAAGDASIAQRLVAIYRMAIIKGYDVLVHSVALALHQTTRDPRGLVREHFGTEDGDLLAHAYQGLSEARDAAKESERDQRPTPARSTGRRSLAGGRCSSSPFRP
jgi:hypothetical protein